MRKRLALALRLMANRLDPVSTSNFVVTYSRQFTTYAAPGVTFTASNGGLYPA